MTANRITSSSRPGAAGLPWWLLLGDWLVLLLFVIIGQRDHGIAGQGALASLLSTSLSLIVMWTVAAWALGGYRLAAATGWRAWLGRVVTIWLVAAPLGLVLRALLRGQTAIPVTFILVAMSIGGLMIVGWRALAYWLARRHAARGAESLRPAGE